MNVERLKLVFFVLLTLSLMYLAFQLRQTRKLVDSGKIGAALDTLDLREISKTLKKLNTLDFGEISKTLKKLNTLDFDKVSSLLNKIDSIDQDKIKQIITFVGKIDDQVCTGNDGYLFKPGKAAAFMGAPTVKIC